MKITKFGHSCLLVEEGNARILVDPGSYSTLQNDAENVDAVLITHEHQDHLNADSVRIIMRNNPKAKIYTNTGVGEKLKAESIPFELLQDKQSTIIKDVLVEGFGVDHAMIYPSYPIVRNTGYRIANKFFYGGDSVENIVPCEILAYPAVAPWMKMEWAIDYAKKIKPKMCFPVHDAFLKFPGPFYLAPEKLLGEAGIQWMVIEEGKSIEV
ncbi:MAG TPA: MBL fold metallo-hydrolase [Patescibacteria group bacterium]|nr:MBL fold metallo-hydrolase [Patescibacteria group bacterium]